MYEVHLLHTNKNEISTKHSADWSTREHSLSGSFIQSWNYWVSFFLLRIGGFILLFKWVCVCTVQARKCISSYTIEVVPMFTYRSSKRWKETGRTRKWYINSKQIRDKNYHYCKWNNIEQIQSPFFSSQFNIYYNFCSVHVVCNATN